jgi:hypothetical protein
MGHDEDSGSLPAQVFASSCVYQSGGRRPVCGRCSRAAAEHRPPPVSYAPEPGRHPGVSASRCRASDFRQDLERQRLIRGGNDDRTAGSAVAIGEPKDHDRRCRDSESVPGLDSLLGLRSPTRSTCTVTTRPCVIRVTNQSRPFRRIVSPIEGSVRRVKSYSKSPFGKRITNALAGTNHLVARLYLDMPVLTHGKQRVRRTTASSIAPAGAGIVCQAVLGVRLPIDWARPRSSRLFLGRRGEHCR